MSHELERRNQTWPGRVTRLGLLFLAACASPDPTAIPPGFTLTDPTQGVVILGREFVDGEGKPSALPGAAGRQTMSCTHEASGESFTLEAVNDGSVADFYALLPAGHYRTVATSGAGVHERFFLVRFAVEPSAVTYAGTLSFSQSLAKGETFGLRDDYDGAAARFRASHPTIDAQVGVSLAEKWACGSTGAQCTPVPWPSSDSR